MSAIYHCFNRFSFAKGFCHQKVFFELCYRKLVLEYRYTTIQFLFINKNLNSYKIRFALIYYVQAISESFLYSVQLTLSFLYIYDTSVNISKSGPLHYKKFELPKRHIIQYTQRLYINKLWQEYCMFPCYEIHRI